MKRTLLNEYDLRILRRACDGTSIYLGENAMSVVAFTPLGVVLKQKDSKNEATTFVYHSHKGSEANVFLGNEHTAKHKSMVNYHKVVHDITYRHFKEGFPESLKQLGMERSELSLVKDLPRAHYSVPDVYLRAECVLDHRWLQKAVSHLSLSSLVSITESIPKKLTPEFIDNAVKIVKARPCEDTKKFLVKVWERYMKEYVDLEKISMEEEGKKMVKLFKELNMTVPSINLFNRVRLFIQCAPMLDDKNGPDDTQDAIGALVGLSNRKPAMLERYKEHIRKQDVVIKQLQNEVASRKKRKALFVIKGNNAMKRGRISSEAGPKVAPQEKGNMEEVSTRASPVAKNSFRREEENTSTHGRSHSQRLFTCKKCKKQAGMCLKPGQEGHLPLAKTRKVHITQTEGVEFDRYVDAIVKYKNEWEKNNPGRKWTGNVPRRYSVELENNTLVNVGRWVQLQKQKNVEGSLEKDSAEYRVLSQLGILDVPSNAA